MRTINLNKAEGIKTFIFPDGQPHVNIDGIQKGDEVKVVCSIADTILLLQLLECGNALKHAGAIKKTLVIPYLMGARYDRLMLPGDSLDLEVMADLINSLEFEKVYLYDVHSAAALSLIRNAENISNKKLVETYDKENAVSICPDKGAAKKIGEYAKWNNKLADTVYCEKSRDLSNGQITLTVKDPHQCEGRNCVIIDDLCDGGGTFIAIAKQIKPAHLTLIVTHGVFSKGFTELEKYFDEIIVSDSYRSDYKSAKLKLIKAEYETV